MSLGKKAGLLGRSSLSSIANKRKSSFSCGSTCEYNYLRRPYYDPIVFTSLASGTNQAGAITEEDNYLNGNRSIYPYPYTSGPVFSYETDVFSFGADPSSTTNIMQYANDLGTADIYYQFFDDEFSYDPGAEQCNDTLTESDQIGIATSGKTVPLVLVDCTQTASTGQIHGGWGLPNCGLTQDLPTSQRLALGGTCVLNGANNVNRYTNSDSTVSTASLTGTRLVDAGCTQFLITLRATLSRRYTRNYVWHPQDGESLA